jgi:hypothetical protein
MKALQRRAFRPGESSNSSVPQESGGSRPRQVHEPKRLVNMPVVEVHGVARIGLVLFRARAPEDAREKDHDDERHDHKR